LDKLFQKGKIGDAEQKRRFMVQLRPELRRLYVVRTYTNIEEMVIAIIEIERVLGDLGETPYDPSRRRRTRMQLENHLQINNCQC
jgi:hypothetical protein